MKALVLCAGRGERLRPLTDHIPKPLVKVQGQPLLAGALRVLARSGVHEVYINTGWLGQQIEAQFGAVYVPFTDGDTNPKSLGVDRQQLYYSREEKDFGHALETAGGIARCLPDLGAVFGVIAADVWMPDFYWTPQAIQDFEASSALACMTLVTGYAQAGQKCQQGSESSESLGLLEPAPRDFGIDPEGWATLPVEGQAAWTYSTAGLYKPAFFDGLPWGNPDGKVAALGPLLREAARQGLVQARFYEGAWMDVGTPQRLAVLNRSSHMASP
jgi:MurNAc alpha-1-phosphate uridylyltransferase